MSRSKSIGGIGIRETQETLDFCAEKEITADLIRHEQARRNSEFSTSGGFEFPDERASVVYLNEWHKRLAGG
jgi:hypothetical protein